MEDTESTDIEYDDIDGDSGNDGENTNSRLCK